MYNENIIALAQLGLNYYKKIRDIILLH